MGNFPLCAVQSLFFTFITGSNVAVMFPPVGLCHRRPGPCQHRQCPWAAKRRRSVRSLLTRAWAGPELLDFPSDVQVRQHQSEVRFKCANHVQSNHVTMIKYPMKKMIFANCQKWNKNDRSTSGHMQHTQLLSRKALLALWTLFSQSG